MWLVKRDGQPTVETGFLTGVASQAVGKSELEADVTVEQDSQL